MKILRTLLFVLLVFALAACTSPAAPAPAETTSTEAPAAAEPASGEKVELVMGSWRVDDAEAWAKILTAFNAEHPNISIKFDPTNPPDYNATLRTQLETGTGPDLLFVRSFATGLELFNAKYVASLKDLPGLEEAIPAATNAPWATADGERYAVPIAAVSHGIYYNQDVFAEQGIEVPKTWEDLLAAADKLKAAGLIPFANGTKDEWDINEVVLMSIIPNDIGGLDGRSKYLSGETCFNDANMVEAFQHVKDLEPYLPTGFTATSYYDSDQLFVQGKAAMLFDGSWTISAIEKDAPTFQWSVFAVPPAAGKDMYVSFHMDAAIGMNAATEHPEEAKTFLQWLETREFAEQFGNGVPGFFGVSKEVPTLANPVAAAFLDLNQQAKGTDIRFAWEKLMDAPSGQESAYTVMNAGAIAVLKGDKTPQEAADDLQAALEKWYEPAKTCKK
jgi:raffinose/stachyose/melibiose transport system substrate-binding protein